MIINEFSIIIVASKRLRVGWGEKEKGLTKDTILRSTINDYFENEPVGRLTAWVYPPVTKNATLGAKRYPWSRFTFLKF